MATGFLFILLGGVLIVSVIALIGCEYVSISQEKQSEMESHFTSRAPQRSLFWLMLIMLITGGLVWLKSSHAPEARPGRYQTRHSTDHEMHDQEDNHIAGIDPADRMAEKLLDVIEREMRNSDIEIPLEDFNEADMPEWLGEDGQIKHISDADSEEEGLIVLRGGYYTNTRNRGGSCLSVCIKAFPAVVE